MSFILGGGLSYLFILRLFPPETEVIVHTSEPLLVVATVVDEIEVTRIVTAIPLSPTGTPEPTFTSTSEPTATSTQELFTLGGADKIAFLNGDDIWLINVDGTDLKQITNDGAIKRNLGWTPDGTAVTYISGKCVWMVNIESIRVDHIACFETAEYLDVFAISPDGTQVLISLNRELYMVPNDLTQLQRVRDRADLVEMSKCEVLAPMVTTSNTLVPVKFVRWGNDNQKIVILKIANDSGRQVDLIQLFEIRSCSSNLIRTDEIPASRFALDNYDNAPYLQNFGYDGEYLISLVSYIRNDGFGNMYIYNADLHKADTQINPIQNACCYRDVQFSPDGRYLIFVYQPYEVGAKAQMYYIPFATVGTGASYQPIPLPESFFEDTRSKPQPALRPAP